METAVKPHTTYKDIYQEVTETVIKLLEEGTVIWQRSWHERGWPKNYISQKHYRGWNLFYLSFHSERKGYPTADYLTYKQANLLGGTIKKGEKGVKIIYWATVELKDKASVKEPLDTNIKTKLIPKTYIVFNVAQTEGIEIKLPSR